MDYLPPPRLDPPPMVQTLVPPKFPPPIVKQAVTVGYPVRPKKEWWYQKVNGVNYMPTAAHLSGGEHKGKFQSEWLNTLSPEELASLHADDHEGRVKWDYAVRPTIKQDLTVQPAFALPASMSSCPGGNCPQMPASQSRGILRLFR